MGGLRASLPITAVVDDQHLSLAWRRRQFRPPTKRRFIGVALMLLRRGTVGFQDGAHMAWLKLGSGPVMLVVVPPASDGLWNVDDLAWRLAWRYRGRRDTFSILAISRRHPLPASWAAELHADDYIRVVEHLEWGPAIWECVSAGGPIGQAVALKRPDLVRGLILSVTLHRITERTRAVLRLWRQLADERRWPKLYWSLVELNARPRGFSRIPALHHIFRLLPPPAHPARFIHLIDELLAIDASETLPQLACPTLVIGGAQDAIIPSSVQREMAASLPRSQLILYSGYGHAVPTQHPDYERQIRRFARLVDGDPN